MGAGELRNPLLRGSYFFVSAYTYNKIRCIGVGIDRVAGRLGGGDPPGDSSLEALARLCAMRNWFDAGECGESVRGEGVKLNAVIINQFDW